MYINYLSVYLSIQIIGGYYHVLALTDDGKLYTWGYNNNGQLGNGSTSSSNVPVQVGNNLERWVLQDLHVLDCCVIEPVYANLSCIFPSYMSDP